MSKPKNEGFTNLQKPTNVDDSIKTAPDGRLIIVDDGSAPLPSKSKSGKSMFTYIFL